MSLRDSETNISNWFGKGLAFAIVIAVLLGSVIFFNEFTEDVTAGEIVVIQSLGGSLTVYTDPGYKLKFFGRATHYKKSFQYSFSSSPTSGTTSDESVPIRFNDGATAKISGQVRVDLPLDEKSILDIHTKLGSQGAVDQQLIRPVIEKSVLLTGTLLTSKESYAERRNDLLNYIQDQASNGVYKTTSTTTTVTDPVTNEQRQATIVSVAKDSTGAFQREDVSPLLEYHITLHNLSMDGIAYSDTVEAQIKAQQEATMQVQTAIATAKKAEQDKLTAEAQGEAQATTAKWEQETINAKVVAEANGRALAAEQDAKAAEFTKQAMISKGQGEAAYKAAVTAANNNLDQKLQALIQINTVWATAFENTHGQLVPSVVFSGNGSGSGQPASSADSLIQLIQARTASQLGVDLTPTAAPAAK